jgi:hypothetical protein
LKTKWLKWAGREGKMRSKEERIGKRERRGGGGEKERRRLEGKNKRRGKKWRGKSEMGVGS